MPEIHATITLRAGNLADLVAQLQGMARLTPSAPEGIELACLEPPLAGSSALQEGEDAAAPPAAEQDAPFLDHAAAPPPADTTAPAVEPPKRRRRAEAAPEKAPPLNRTPVLGEAAHTPPEPAVEGAAVNKAPTDFEVLRELLVQVQSRHKLAGVIQLLAETTGQRRLTDVPPEDYPRVTKAAESLLIPGARLQ